MYREQHLWQVSWMKLNNKTHTQYKESTTHYKFVKRHMFLISDSKRTLTTTTTKTNDNTFTLEPTNIGSLLQKKKKTITLKHMATFGALTQQQQQQTYESKSKLKCHYMKQKKTNFNVCFPISTFHSNER